ncbi:hypothetical protein GW915_05125 [bacterium]|nr:hypothetical protein [bacterium]
MPKKASLLLLSVLLFLGHALSFATSYVGMNEAKLKDTLWRCRLSIPILGIPKHPKLQYPIFDPEVHPVPVDILFPDLQPDAIVLEYLNLTEIEQLAAVTACARRLDAMCKSLFQTLLIQSKHVSVRKKVALEISSNPQNQGVPLARLWLAQHLEPDPELASLLETLASNTKNEATRYNREQQSYSKLEVRDAFFSENLSPSEKQVLSEKVRMGRSPVYHTEEAIFIELAKHHRRTILKYQNEIKRAKRAVSKEQNNNKKAIKQQVLEKLEAEYIELIQYIDKTRLYFRDGLYSRELARIHDLNMGQIKAVLADSSLINNRYFPNATQPFTAGQPAYVVQSTGTLEVARGWGGKANQFAGFYQPPRLSAFLSSEEIREIVATPSLNSHSYWSFFKVPANHFMVLGLVAPQRELNAGVKKDWGIGGNGGELQYWAPQTFEYDSSKWSQGFLPSETHQWSIKVSLVSERVRNLQKAALNQRNDFEKLAYLWTSIQDELNKQPQNTEKQKAALLSERNSIRDYFLEIIKMSLDEKGRYFKDGYDQERGNLSRLALWSVDIKRVESETKILLENLFDQAGTSETKPSAEALTQAFYRQIEEEIDKITSDWKPPFPAGPKTEALRVEYTNELKKNLIPRPSSMSDENPSRIER